MVNRSFWVWWGVRARTKQEGRRPCEHGGQGRVLHWGDFGLPYVESHVIFWASVREHSAVARECPALSGQIGE